MSQGDSYLFHWGCQVGGMTLWIESRGSQSWVRIKDSDESMTIETTGRLGDMRQALSIFIDQIGAR